MLLVLFTFHFSLITSHAQAKLSPWLRQIAKQEAAARAIGQRPTDSRTVIAFIRLSSDDSKVLAEYGSKSLAHFGDLHIASIPLAQLTPMCADSHILRIEASPCGHVLMDTTAVIVNSDIVHEGTNLPQAYTGKNVIMGVMDIGFDLTHPNFYSADTTRYRIKRFWDMLSQDTIGSAFPVGRDFSTREELLALGHARDGLDYDHGTHTLGIAAGSGYDSPYGGMAPDADICLVANAVSDDLKYIDSADVYKYTYAVDALGFKYLFDYAQSVGKPCVASFSEGSQQDFYGYDQLYYAFLDSLSGPGRIIVAAAGNNGNKRNYIHKPVGLERAGTFLRHGDSTMVVVMKSKDNFNMRLVAYSEPYDTLTVNLQQVIESEDSTLTCEMPNFTAVFEAYPSCYNDAETCLDLTVVTDKDVGSSPRLSLELLGIDADIEMWRMNGQFNTYPVNPALTDGQSDHYIHSPSSAPCVICVGATSWRDHMVNINGDVLSNNESNEGSKAMFSSMGPTFDGRTKPDCVAPGNYVYSSYSSFKLEAHPNDIAMHSALFPFNGRTYAWGASSGTSMSTPAVAGAIALWLEACPTLTYEDVKGVLQRTCHHVDASLPYPNNSYGYGEVDVYAGLLDILGFSSIRDIPQQHAAARIALNGRTLHIQLPEKAHADVPLRIYDLNGRSIFNGLLGSGNMSHEITLPSLSRAVYAVCIGNTSTLVRCNE